MHKIFHLVGFMGNCKHKSYSMPFRKECGDGYQVICTACGMAADYSFSEMRIVSSWHLNIPAPRVIAEPEPFSWCSDSLQPAFKEPDHVHISDTDLALV